MAGRGTDIMLGGNAEYMALSDLRKQGLPDELVAEANSYAETENPEILAVRESYKQLLAQHKAEIAEEAARVREAGGLACARPAACSSSARSATSPAVSTISSAVVPAVRETRVSPVSTFPWKMI